MPRLSRAQREAKEARQAAVAAQHAADAQTAIGGGPNKARPPPPPLASALSTNQPITINNRAVRVRAAVGPNGEIDKVDESLELQRSPSLERTPAIARRHEASSSAAPASPPPPHNAASDVSTSDDSDQEGLGNDTRISMAVDDTADGDEEDEVGDATLADGNPEVKCMWEDCGQVFTSLLPFINHLHEEHVGIHKARYSCEWSGCPRKGKGQTSRFALLSHLRSHTGEKPFTCPRPECDKSFTRSDALAKHMRVQHNVTPLTSRGKAAAQHGMPSTRRLRGDLAEDDDLLMAAGDDGVGRASDDVLADELLELAEGDTNGSLAEVEQSLMMLGAKSPFFTYDNLFGAGSRAMAQLGETMFSGSGLISDKELGIVRDTKAATGLLFNDDALDDETIAREELDMARALELGRRDWVRAEREWAEQQPDLEVAGIKSKRDQIDYLSDEDGDDSRSVKRTRRSSTRNAQRQAQSLTDVANLKRLYIVEKAKLRLAQRMNQDLRDSLAEMREFERTEMLTKRRLLERALEAELGKDVGAIFSPSGSPAPDARQ